MRVGLQVGVLWNSKFKIQNSKLRSCDLFMIEFEGKEIREVREVREFREFKESPP